MGISGDFGKSGGNSGGDLGSSGDSGKSGNSGDSGIGFANLFLRSVSKEYKEVGSIDIEKKFYVFMVYVFKISRFQGLMRAIAQVA